MNGKHRTCVAVSRKSVDIDFHTDIMTLEERTIITNRGGLQTPKAV